MKLVKGPASILWMIILLCWAILSKNDWTFTAILLRSRHPRGNVGLAGMALPD